MDVLDVVTKGYDYFFYHQPNGKRQDWNTNKVIEPNPVSEVKEEQSLGNI